LLKETGTLERKTLNRKWKKIDPEKLKKYIDDNPDAYLREIAAEFHCTLYAIQKALARLKISRKKNAGISGEE
jgi:transposase